jgi:hypothetical protein
VTLAFPADFKAGISASLVSKTSAALDTVLRLLKQRLLCTRDVLLSPLAWKAKQKQTAGSNS